MLKRVASLFISISIGFGVLPAVAEDGYELWLRYEQLEARPADAPRHVMAACAEPSETLQAALAEIERATESLLGNSLQSTDRLRSRTLVLASADCADAIDEADLPTTETVGAEGFALRATRVAEVKKMMVERTV